MLEDVDSVFLPLASDTADDPRIIKSIPLVMASRCAERPILGFCNIGMANPMIKPNKNKISPNKINWSDLDVASQVPYSDSFYKDDYLMNITADEIMVFVQRLPVSYRTVFSLSVVEGYNHNEIAEMLGISESASRSNLSKAKAKLQSWISAYVVQQNEITHKHE